jgi:hypothetical protein
VTSDGHGADMCASRHQALCAITQLSVGVATPTIPGFACRASTDGQVPYVNRRLDATTGRIFWVYSLQPSQLARLCRGRVNRGLAILGNTLFMGTPLTIGYSLSSTR